MKEPFFIHHFKRTAHYTMATNHFHDQYEIYYLLEGERFYFIKDCSYRIGKGDIVFIDKYELHKTGDAGLPGHERILINFDDRFLDCSAHAMLSGPFQAKLRRLSLPPEERAWVETVLYDMLLEAKAGQQGSGIALQAQLSRLLVRCARLMQRDDSGSGGFEHESPAHRKITEIVAYLNTAFGEPLSLESVAKAHFVSPSYLSRTFKRVTGFSFVEYVNSIRIKEAQRLLRETSWKVTRIAEQVGYENIGHFGRVFKTISRTHPLDYRRAHAELGKSAT
ncbi:AraC family transcriptional regulator [Paenibacillus sp. MBLB4367]|uniref:AraC family transcriptional regulator n=1 Tax=Paenibacillus sp. MBLB4367 TaxID=3384767 RepID=UPI00390839FC